MIQHAMGGKEIPIPGIVRVPTYHTDYLPVRRERNTYIRPKGKAAAAYEWAALSLGRVLLGLRGVAGPRLAA